MAAAQTEKAKGALSSKRQVPCEDIQIRFPVPEAWIYLFREERRWGVGSVHAKVRRPGKVKVTNKYPLAILKHTKNLRDFSLSKIFFHFYFCNILSE